MKKVFLENEQIYKGNLILVNAQYPYMKNRAEQELVPVTRETPEILMEKCAAEALNGLMKEIQGWEQIVPVSGWRSFAEQEEIFAQSLQENGEAFTKQFVALPGHSEHQTGLAIDLALRNEKIDFICPEFPYEGICQSFREMAPLYGFVERYPKDKEYITGISHEPWHFRYVGTPHAQIIAEKNLVLEEYLDFLKSINKQKDNMDTTGGQ